MRRETGWMSTFVSTSSLVLLAVATSGCTLIHDNDPFRVSVLNHLAANWDGTVIVLEEDGDERFRRDLSVPARSMSLTLDLPPLVGEFTFIVESGGSRWQGQATTAEGSYSWTVVIEESGAVCFDFLLGGTSRTECPPRSPA